MEQINPKEIADKMLENGYDPKSMDGFSDCILDAVEELYNLESEVKKALDKPPTVNVSDLVVYVIEAGKGIDQRSSVEEIMDSKLSKTYGVGEFFQAMNDELIDIKNSFTFLINVDTKEELNEI